LATHRQKEELMSLKWYQVEDIVGREATTTRQKAESVLADLQRRQQLRREQEEAEALESREAREKLSANWLLSQQRVRAADDIEVANRALTELGWTDLIPTSESNVSSQIMSGGSWANSIINQVRVVTQQARLDDIKKEAKEWAQWSVRQGDGTWANLSPAQQTQMINQWTNTLLSQRYPEEYGALAVAEPTEIPTITPEITPWATKTTPEMQLPTVTEPKTEIPPEVAQNLTTTITITPQDVALQYGGYDASGNWTFNRPALNITIAPDLNTGEFVVLGKENEPIGTVDAETGNINFDDPLYPRKAMVMSQKDYDYLNERDYFVPPPTGIKAAVENVRNWLWSPKQIGETTIPAPATILGLIGFVGTIALTGIQAYPALKMVLQGGPVGQVVTNIYKKVTIPKAQLPKVPTHITTIQGIRDFRAFQNTAVYQDLLKWAAGKGISPTVGSQSFNTMQNQLFTAYQYHLAGDAVKAQQIIDQIRYASGGLPGAVPGARAVTPYTGAIAPPTQAPPTQAPPVTQPIAGVGGVPTIIPSAPMAGVQGVAPAVAGLAGVPAIGGAVSGKEPWQMTQVEYIEAHPIVQKIGGGKKTRIDQHKAAVLQAIDELKPVPQEVLGEYGYANRARAMVKQALSEGKPVPAEVLADYPDLAKVTPEAVKVTAQTVSVGSLDKGTWVQLKPDGVMYQVDEHFFKGKRTSLIDGEGKISTFPSRQQVYRPFETKVTPEAVKPTAPAVEITAPVTPEIAQLRIQPISELSTEDIKTVGVRALVSKISKLKVKEKNLPLEYKTQINSILANFDTKFRTNRTLGKRQAIKDYVSMLEETDGIVANVPEELIELANKTPLRAMTTEQLQMLHDEIAKLVHLGALKNKLIKVQAGRRLGEAVNELVKQLGGAKEPPIYTKETKEGALLSKSPIGESYLNRAYRIERIFLQEDGYVEGGLFQTTFYKPINDARNQVLREDYTFLEESHRPFLKENNLDISKLIGKSEEIAPGVKLTLSEKMGVYLNSLNEDNLLHLKYGNKFSDELIRTVVDSLTPEQKAYAKFLQSHVASQGAEVSKVMTQIEGRGLDLVENYWPIVLDQEALPEMNFEKALAQEQGLRFAAKWASSRIPKSFTKARTHKAIQPVNLDALAVFNKHIQRVYHYKAYAPAIRDLQLIINNPKFKKAFILNEGKARYQVLDKWVRQNAEIDPLAVRSESERWFRIARTRSIAAITGINLTMSLRQFPSWFTGMAELGELPTIKGLAQVIKDYKGTRALIREHDPQTYRRSWAWEIGEKAMARKVMGKLSPQEVFSILVRTADKFTVTSLWRGAFDEYLRKNPGMFKEAGEEAARLIRRTQPMFEVKDLAEIYRSGEFMKVVVAWTNQLNQNLNYYRFDIAGKYGAGKIGTGTLIRRIIEAFVIPGLIIGWSIRSRPAKNAKEFVEDMATQATGTIPVVGSYLASIFKGYTADVDLMTFAALEKAQQILAQIYRGDWEKAFQTSPELAGYLAGLPTVQTKRFIQGILDLASGKTDDWARLIWGGYTREKYIEEDGTIKTEALDEVGQLFYEKNFDELTKEEQEVVLALFKP